MSLVCCKGCGYICTVDEYRAHELGKVCDMALDKDDFHMFCRIGQQLKRIADSLDILNDTSTAAVGPETVDDVECDRCFEPVSRYYQTVCVPKE